MDVASISGQASTLSQSQLSDVVSTSVLRKAIDIQAQGALQLLQALPPVANNPPNLGNTIDVRA
ncbi:YjfB family protein [Dechloromonas sp. CZR5]|uniref:YjfB family protein n=1 Tax=Dechloromonas sp. CZR5 TaxID=2608630 RepID=UPI00123D66DB|nr:YjfB family protein [Dechloromonas sp. CZR5]